MKKKIYFLLILIVITYTSLTGQGFQATNILFLNGSNIYVRIFLFFFPISNKYEPVFSLQKNFFNLDIFIKRDDIKKEPSTPSYFDSDLIFHIKNIPYNKSGKFKIPVTLQCNKKFIKKKVNFTIYYKRNILILKGALNNLYIKEITENEYFKKRLKWKFPLYFDIRLQLEDNIDRTKLIKKEKNHRFHR